MEDTTKQVVIIGSGLSGLMTAYELAKLKISSLVVSKGPLNQTNTWMAQGGVAAAVAKSDSIENHLQDTLVAGDGLCIPKNVKKILSLGPEVINNLINEGMRFDSKDTELSLGQEGGHHHRRILHVDDQTGRALHEFLLYKLQHTPISQYCKFLPNSMVASSKKTSSDFELRLLDLKSNKNSTLICSHLVLATGGAGKAFLYTSNWDGATGDGLKVAYDLGATLKNLEMVQFHPTCLHHSRAKNFLISEALRGEGAKLLDQNGHRFAFDFHPDGELAPRDVVSRAIEYTIKSSGRDCVFLDISHLSKKYLQSRFPTIYRRCLDLGLDISADAIPVVPAAHYTCGGIDTSKDLVTTSVERLYAVGECGYTGLHGANRLASNSLLECLVTAQLCVLKIKSQSSALSSLHKPTPYPAASTNKPHHRIDELFLINALWDEARSLMWNYVGIQRSTQRLNQALEKLTAIEFQVSRLNPVQPSRDYFELCNIIFFSKNCVLSALSRNESRGCHYNIDHSSKSDKLFETSIAAGNLSRVSILQN